VTFPYFLFALESKFRLFMSIDQTVVVRLRPPRRAPVIDRPDGRFLPQLRTRKGVAYFICRFEGLPCYAHAANTTRAHNNHVTAFSRQLMSKPFWCLVSLDIEVSLSAKRGSFSGIFVLLRRSSAKKGGNHRALLTVLDKGNLTKGATIDQ
jgi:hypothetical protein